MIAVQSVRPIGLQEWRSNFARVAVADSNDAQHRRGTVSNARHASLDPFMDCLAPSCSVRSLTQ